MNVREGDVAARITIRRSGDLSRAAEVSWWTEGGTAVADVDYADLGARVERFAPGRGEPHRLRAAHERLSPRAREELHVLLGRGEGEVVARTHVDIVDDD